MQMIHSPVQRIATGRLRTFGLYITTLFLPPISLVFVTLNLFCLVNAESTMFPVQAKFYSKVQKMNATMIRQSSTATYSCPMRCEGTKTYDKPGKCPRCSMDLAEQKNAGQFKVNVHPLSQKIVAGQPVDIQFSIFDPSEKQVNELETVHEKQLHLLIVSKDLGWFAHEHPSLLDDGSFEFSFTFPEAGESILFFDFTPQGAGQQIVQVPIDVAGARAGHRELAFDADEPKTIDGYTVSFATHGLPTTRSSTRLSYTLTKDDQPVKDLQPYLGALGHLVIISSDLNEFVHAHPADHTPADDVHGHQHDDHHHHVHTTPLAGGPTVDFLAHFRTPGIYKSWAQFQLPGENKNSDSRILTVPMTFAVYE